MPKGESLRNYYPHLLPKESSLWRRFLAAEEESFEKFEYDVHVGRGNPPADVPANPYTRNFEKLTQKRIDVVGWAAGRPTIFEVRPRGDFSMMGKLLGYRALFEEKFPAAGRPGLWLVCEILSPDDKILADQYKIKVSVFPADE